ncbi:MAG: response regulator, partial [Cyanobacteria bacterium]|nr:response regulator [Cyanobacteriota bacterium]
MEHSLGEAVDRRILIVGKPVDTLHLLTAMLADWGYGVAVTSDYGIASHTVQALAPDVILLSVSAGSADGYDVCDRLQADKTTRAIPILIVGEGDDPALRLQAFAVGAVDYIARRSTALEEIAARLDVHAVRCQTVRQLQQEIVQRDHALRQHQAIENRLELLLNLTQAISKAESFDAALEAALQLLGSATGWDYGEAWVESVDGLVLECNPSWYRRQLDIDATLAAAINEFRRFSEALTFAPHEGMPGRVWQGQHSEFINDMTVGSRSLFLRDDLAQMCGFRAALAVPILLPTSSPNLVRSTQRVLAVLCFFSSNAYPQDSYLLQLVSAVAAQLGTLLAQKQVEAEMRALFNAMTDVVLVQDASGRCIRVVP